MFRVVLALPLWRINFIIIQMMHSSEWTLKYDEPEVENVARGHSQSATFSTGGHHVSMLHERPWFICLSRDRLSL